MPRPRSSIPGPDCDRRPVRRSSSRVTLLFLALAAFTPATAAFGDDPARGARRPNVTVAISKPAFSPNGDGVRDRIRVAVSVDVPSTLTVSVLDERGTVVVPLATSVPVQAGRVDFVWTGKTAAGRRVDDGTYTVLAQAVDGGTPGEARSEVVVDTTRPHVGWRGRWGQRVFTAFFSLGLRVSDARSLRVHLALGLYGQNGDLLDRLRPTVKHAGKLRLGWSPRAGGHRLPPGAYRIALAARDDAGNATAVRPRPFLVERPVRPHIIARVDGVGRRVALTFDDCGSPSAWLAILNILRRRGVKAGFFCPGQTVLAAPFVARRTLRDGHTIGSHGWDHAYFPGLSYGAALSRLVEDREVWWRLARAAATPLFRPPYGAYSATTLAAAGRAGYTTIVLWDVDPRDWTGPGSAVVAARVLHAVRPGSIVLLHVSGQTAYALPTILNGLRARHLQPIRLADLIAQGRPSPAGWPRYYSR